ncbi:MAG: helix-turn-helix transcriptional regulator [Oscillospiraceae bacterium]|nr:helix-turn-helix transcriptional regulator [Oscillospiraceae bacterium]
MNTFSERLRIVMKQRRINQVELAGKIGINQASVSRIIRGELNPSDRTIRDICAALRINEAWLRGGVGEMERETPDSYTAALARQYGLTAGGAAMINALAHALMELNEEQQERLTARLIDELTRIKNPGNGETIPGDELQKAAGKLGAEEDDQSTVG